MKTWMRTIAVVTSLAALGACGGSTGPQGPAGPAGATGATGATGGGFYANRGDMYCNSNVMANGATSVSAACNTTQDLPVSGGCSSSGGGVDIALNVDAPFGWNGTVAADIVTAEWNCEWTSASNGAVNVPGAQATICCVKHP